MPTTILSAFFLPSVGLSVVAFPAGLFAILAGGLGFLLIPGTDETEEAENVRVLIPLKVGVVLGSREPCVREFLENSFPQ